ncbi:hypothetical protein KKC_11066 [Listeria fleischmannii subsp. coloradonensis]|nr:hypothetical protein KKC_11066 [Listeria fleischmannii subsp. coloradonensis]
MEQRKAISGLPMTNLNVGTEENDKWLTNDKFSPKCVFFAGAGIKMSADKTAQ